MKILTSLLIVCILLIAANAGAGEFGEVKKKIGDARKALLVMVKDRNKRGDGYQEIVKKTANAVSDKLSKMNAPDGKEALFQELVDTWKAFKKTRENDLTTLILADNQEEIERIAHGIQQERLSRMYQLCDELDK